RRPRRGCIREGYCQRSQRRRHARNRTNAAGMGRRHFLRGSVAPSGGESGRAAAETDGGVSKAKGELATKGTKGTERERNTRGTRVRTLVPLVFRSLSVPFVLQTRNF